jgi:repressor LexA
MLTDMQLRTLRFIEARVGTTGVAPSYSELAKALGVSSKSGVNRLVCALEERGYIRRIPHRARAIEVVRRPTTLLDPARELRAYLDARHGQGFTAALLAARPRGPVEFIHGGRLYNTHPEAERDAEF